MSLSHDAAWYWILFLVYHCVQRESFSGGDRDLRGLIDFQCFFFFNGIFYNLLWLWRIIEDVDGWMKEKRKFLPLRFVKIFYI